MSHLTDEVRVARIRNLIVRHERTLRPYRNAALDALLSEIHEALGDHEPTELPPCDLPQVRDD